MTCAWCRTVLRVPLTSDAEFASPRAEYPVVAPAPANTEPDPAFSTIRFRCHHCYGAFDVPKSQAGQRITCASCRTILRVPLTSAPEFSGPRTGRPLKAAALRHVVKLQAAALQHAGRLRGWLAGASPYRIAAGLGTFVLFGVLTALLLRQMGRQATTPSGTNMEQMGPQATTPSGPIDIADMYHAFVADPSSAQEKYGGKRLQVRGVVHQTLVTDEGFVVVFKYSPTEPMELIPNPPRFQSRQIPVGKMHSFIQQEAILYDLYLRQLHEHGRATCEFPVAPAYDCGFEYRFYAGGRPIASWHNGQRITISGVCKLTHRPGSPSLPAVEFPKAKLER
jgi:hypothetical protein